MADDHPDYDDDYEDHFPCPKAVTTFIVTADSPVISSTCVFDVPHDVQQNVKQGIEDKNGA